jgi:hypothetical protein
MPVRPKIAEGLGVSNNVGPDQLKTIEVEEVESEGAETEKAEEEEEEEDYDDKIKNPIKWWNVEEDDGLGQDALRPDPAKKRTRRTPAVKTGGEGEGDDEERGRKAKKNTVVHRPTREEMEQHLTTHCPFKAWCKHCVQGRATNTQHRRGKEKATGEDTEEETKVPRVSFDYFFMSKADEEAKENPILAMVDE